MVAQLNKIEQLWWHWMESMFWQVSLLILLVSAIDMAIRRWAWPQVRYVLWGLVFLKLVIPPTWQMPTSIVSWIQPMIEKHISIQIEPREKIPAIDLEMETDDVSLNPVATSDGSGRLSGKRILFLGWIAGMITFGFILIRKMLQLRRWYRYKSTEAIPDLKIPEWFHTLLSDTAARLNLKKRPTVIFSGEAKSPAVYGLFRTVLLLPEEFFNRLSREEAEHILIHELCHLKRGDLWVHWFCLVLQMVYWFNPLLIWTRRRMRHLCEICCDLSVANILREKTRHYRDTLIRTARDLFTETVEPGLGLLGVFEEPFRIVPRLQWLEKKTWENRKRKSAAILFTSVVMMVCVMPMAGISKSVAQNQDLSLENELQQLEISAESIRDDIKSKSLFLTGNVFISSELMTIAADNATILAKEPFVADQKISSESIIHIEANGNVRLESKEGTATSEKAVYDRETNILVLSGGVWLYKDSNTISGDIVVIDNRSGKITVENAAATVEPTDVVYDIVDAEEPPRPIRIFPPKYPSMAKQEKIQGRVLVELVVTKGGTPKDALVIDAEPPAIFEEAALDAVRSYIFTPGRRNGVPVDVRVRIPVQFILDEPDEYYQLDPEAKDRSGIKYELFEVDRPPRVQRAFPPKYPLFAKQEQIEGRVLVRMVVDAEGKAQEPEVVMAVPYGVFEESALDVIKLYQFEPALMSGTPVDCIVQVPIVYSLGIENNQPASLPEEVISFNFHNAGIKAFVNFVGDMTGKRFVIDDDVIGKVTVQSLSGISIHELERIFESVLDSNGFEAVPSGESIRIKRKGF